MDELQEKIPHELNKVVVVKLYSGARYFKKSKCLGFRNDVLRNEALGDGDSDGVNDGDGDNDGVNDGDNDGDGVNDGDNI